MCCLLSLLSVLSAWCNNHMHQLWNTVHSCSHCLSSCIALCNAIVNTFMSESNRVLFLGLHNKMFLFCMASHVSSQSCRIISKFVNSLLKIKTTMLISASQPKAVTLFSGHPHGYSCFIKLMAQWHFIPSLKWNMLLTPLLLVVLGKIPSYSTCLSNCITH